MNVPTVKYWFVGGIVPESYLSLMMSILYAAGADQRQIKIQPIVPEETLKPGPKPKPKLKAIAAPLDRFTGIDRNPGRTLPAKAKRPTMTDAVIAGMQAADRPMSRKELIVVLSASGHDGNHINTPLAWLRKHGYVKRLGAGSYGLGPTPYTQKV